MRQIRYPLSHLSPSLAAIVARYRSLAPGVVLDPGDDEILTVVCDALKFEEFAEQEEFLAWAELKGSVAEAFLAWTIDGTNWEGLAQAVVEENRLLYSDDKAFSRIVEESARGLPGEVSSFMIRVADPK